MDTRTLIADEWFVTFVHTGGKSVYDRPVTLCAIDSRSHTGLIVAAVERFTGGNTRTGKRLSGLCKELERE